MLKRFLDILLSIVSISISFPLWLFISLFIKTEDGGPVFYFQERIGRNDKIFKAVKFRSMIFDAEKYTGPVWASENDSRVTRIGRILRVTAMDELPQLWNILKGDMSFVGPRPERPELVSRFVREIPDYNLRHTLRPGLTGLAQVFGRYDSSPLEKFRYDILYIKNHSLSLDIYLIILSFLVTFMARWESREEKLGLLTGRLKEIIKS